MKVTFDNWGGETQTDEDMGKKFINCYVLAQGLDKCVSTKYSGEQVIYVTNFANNNVQFGTSDHEPWATLRSNIEIVKALPDVGVYALGEDRDGVVVVRRLPMRQWHEGLCKGNTHLLFNGLEEFKGGTIPWTTALDLFKPQVDLTLEQGLAKLKPGKCQRLTSTHWLRSDEGGATHLYDMSKRIGSWAEGEFFYARAKRLSSRLCEDDLKEALNANL